MKTDNIYVYTEDWKLCNKCKHVFKHLSYVKCNKFDKVVYATRDKKDKCKEFENETDE